MEKMNTYTIILSFLFIGEICTKFVSISLYKGNIYMINCYISKWHFVWEENYIIYLLVMQIPTKVIWRFLILTIIFLKK